MNDITDLDLPTVHQAWSAVMADVREIRKDDLNEFQKFRFRGIDAVMNAVGPIFRKHGISCVPSRVVEAKHRDFLSGKDKLQHEAILTVEYRVTGPRGDSFTGESIGEAADTSDKATSQAMSVALRTFLLQGLTMPTDDVDPDHNTVDRAAEPEAPLAPSWQDQGWSDEGERAAQFADLAERSAALPDDLKSKLRAWCKKNNATPEGLTFEVATAWAAALSKAEGAEPAIEETVTDPKEQGWKSAAERKRTFKSLHERLGALPAYEAEVIQGQFDSIGLTGAGDDFTKQQSVELLALITEAEDLAKGDGS